MMTQEHATSLLIIAASPMIVVATAYYLALGASWICKANKSEVRDAIKI